MNDFVLVGECFNRLDADLLKVYIEEEGIDCMIQSDDGGGTMPYLSFAHGVKIYVPEKDVVKAKEIIGRHKLLD